MGASGYESWFVSARDPVSPRALWIRHTRHRPRQGPESAALWCTVIDRDPELGQRPAVIKQVFSAFPPEAAAGPGQFRGQAAMGEHSAHWDLAITGQQPPLRPLRPPVLYRAPLPRTKLEAVVPDAQVAGLLQVDGRAVSVSGWRGTAGHNWGSEHADSWVWLHAADFGGAPEAWLELVLARLGRRSRVDARPGHLAADVYAPGTRLRLSVTLAEDDRVAVAYADPRGGTRTVTHAALASVELTMQRPGNRELTLSSSHAAYEYGARPPVPGIVPRSLPEG
jgi:hypothetical protein